MTVSSVINASLEMSGELGDPIDETCFVQDWKGCLEVASVAWSLLLGKRLILKHHGKVHCLR